MARCSPPARCGSWFAGAVFCSAPPGNNAALLASYRGPSAAVARLSGRWTLDAGRWTLDADDHVAGGAALTAEAAASGIPRMRGRAQLGCDGDCCCCCSSSSARSRCTGAGRAASGTRYLHSGSDHLHAGDTLDPLGAGVGCLHRWAASPSRSTVKEPVGRRAPRDPLIEPQRPSAAVSLLAVSPPRCTAHRCLARCRVLCCPLPVRCSPSAGIHRARPTSPPPSRA